MSHYNQTTLFWFVGTMITLGCAWMIIDLLHRIIRLLLESAVKGSAAPAVPSQESKP